MFRAVYVHVHHTNAPAAEHEPLPYCVVVMVYRAYAFTGYKTTILILLGSCYLALVGGELWAFLTPPVAVPDIFFKLIGNTGCFPNYNDSLMQPRVVVGSISPVLGLTSTCPNQFIMVSRSKCQKKEVKVLNRIFILQQSAAMVMDLVSLLVVLFVRPGFRHPGPECSKKTFYCSASDV